MSFVLPKRFLMQILSMEDIEALGISDESILKWAEQAFLIKSSAMVPPKINQSFNEGRNFFNTMPAIIPSLDVAGVKVVSRYLDRKPSIRAELLLYKFSSGEPLAFMDATWITAKRTGAVAALALETFARKDYECVAVMGLGQAGQCFLDMFLASEGNHRKKIKLLSHGNKAVEVKKLLEARGCKEVRICETEEELIVDSDVIVSAITIAEGPVGEDHWFEKGCLVVPIHTRGFENCDLFFEKVFADDASHVQGFKFFNEFRKFGEIGDVLSGVIKGRQGEDERILAYNIGIALQDVYVAAEIVKIMQNYRSKFGCMKPSVQLNTFD